MKKKSRGYALNWRRLPTTGTEHLLKPNGKTACELLSPQQVATLVPTDGLPTRPCGDCLWTMETSHLMRYGLLGVPQNTPVAS